MIENVKGFLDPKFEEFRRDLKKQLNAMGYAVGFRLFDASQFGVSQRRPRVVIVALRRVYADQFLWPKGSKRDPAPVGEKLFDLMAANGWRGVQAWRRSADDVAPTIVGGSKKHGGADLGPTGTKRAWAALGVNGASIADVAPDRRFVGMPRLTLPMVARLQGFPNSGSSPV